MKWCESKNSNKIQQKEENNNRGVQTDKMTAVITRTAQEEPSPIISSDKNPLKIHAGENLRAQHRNQEELARNVYQQLTVTVMEDQVSVEQNHHQQQQEKINHHSDVTMNVVMDVPPTLTKRQEGTSSFSYLLIFFWLDCWVGRLKRKPFYALLNHPEP